MRNYEGPNQYRPLGAWAYVGLSILYAIPIVGWVFLIIFTFSGGNINRRSFTRSYWCWLLLVIILGGGIFAFLRSSDNEISNTLSTILSGYSSFLKEKGTSSLSSFSWKSYEEIYSSYSEKIKATTPALIEEYKTEANAAGKSINDLATLANEKVSKLAEISVKGTEDMAQYMMLKAPGTSDKYMEWAEKLNAVYMEEAQKITDVYMNSAIG